MKPKKQRIKLREARISKELSLSNVAKEIGISRSFYNQIETGERNPSLDNAIKICELLNIDVRDWQ